MNDRKGRCEQRVPPPTVDVQLSPLNHCGVDACMLLKVGGRWKITQVADTSRNQGCTHTEPPSER